MRKRWIAVPIAAIILMVALGVTDVSVAEMPANDAGDAVILTITEKGQDRIVVYHKNTQSFLLYGSSGTRDQELQLLQIRKLEKDFKLAEKLAGLPYNKKGYTSKEVRQILEDVENKLDGAQETLPVID